MVTDISKGKTFPAQIHSHQPLIQQALDRGAIEAKVILTRTITLGNWVKLRCQFGCPFYGKRFTCPDSTPSSDEMGDILSDYKKALVVKTENANSIHDLVLGLENYFREQGFHKAFALDALPCNLCDVCTIDTQCEHPDKARPTLQACGIDVALTMNNIGWTSQARLQPCTEHSCIGMVLID